MNAVMYEGKYKYVNEIKDSITNHFDDFEKLINSGKFDYLKDLQEYQKIKSGFDGFKDYNFKNLK